MTNRANPRLKKAAALAALTLALSLPASGILAASTFEAHYTTASVTAQEQIAGNLLNLDRSNYNLAELTIDPALSRIARLKSEDMRDNRYFAHVSPTYGDVRDMLSKLGYAYTAAGENIAHHATIEKAQAALISSPGHRRNILSRGYTKVGVGVALDENGYVYNDYGNIVYEKKQRQEVPASDIVYDTYDFNFTGQTMEGMQLQNAVRVKDENGTKDSTIKEIEPFDGVVPGEIYLIASSAKIAVIKPDTTVRADLNYERVRVNDPNSSITIAEDPHIKQVYKTVSYIDQVSNDTASVNEFVVNYNLANYATLRGTTKVAPVNKPDVLPHVSELVYPNVTEISTGNWAIPSADALATEYAKYADQVHDILENHLKVYPYVLISTDPANEAEFLAPETEQDDGIYSNAYANNGKGTSWWVRIGNENGYALDANQTISLETGKLHFDSTNEQLKNCIAF